MSESARLREPVPLEDIVDIVLLDEYGSAQMAMVTWDTASA